MNQIYKEARAAYKAQQFPAFSVRADDLDPSVAVYSNGKFIGVYASRLVAEREIEAQCAKARKFIQ